ncbi:MAG: PKD domain-containing protein, partial [Thaumarchaeota archaeon]|nr:PKD domain-containing protein [Nitrososphaerota archaeon]
TYVAVASNSDDGVQILDVSTPSSINAVSQITDNSTLELDGVIGITSFKIGTSTYVAVASNSDDGVQILDVSTPSSISAVSQITDDSTLELDGAYAVTSFKIGTSTYVAVAAFSDNGVQILKLNRAPTANAGSNQSVAPGTLVTLNGSGSDPDGDTISYSWVKTAGPSVMLSSTTAQNPTFTAPSSAGTITFTLTVSDGTHSTTDTVTITVTTIQNQPPTANAGSNQSVVVDTLVTLSGSGTDPDGDDNNLRYTWKQTSGTPTVTIDDPASARTTFTAPADPTELVFTLTVSDGPDSTTDDITITIKERPVQIRNIKEIDDIIVSSQITAPNQITMMYNEELSTFINSYLNFTITGETTSRSIIGINGSPSKSMMVNIDGQDTNVFVTILTFDGEAVPTNSTGTMYMQHTDYYLKFIQVSDGQD